MCAENLTLGNASKFVECIEILEIAESIIRIKFPFFYLTLYRGQYARFFIKKNSSKKSKMRKNTIVVP